MQIDLSKYPEKCESCGSPAQTQLVTGGPWDTHFDWEYFQFCVNPKCWQYDQNITRERERMEREARESASYERKRKRLWMKEIRAHNRAQRKVRQAVNDMMANQ
jgi:hypothetical protein